MFASALNRMLLFMKHLLPWRVQNGIGAVLVALAVIAIVGASSLVFAHESSPPPGDPASPYYYRRLGLEDENPDPVLLKLIIKRLRLYYHPDKHPGEPPEKWTRLMGNIEQAYHAIEDRTIPYENSREAEKKSETARAQNAERERSSRAHDSFRERPTVSPARSTSPWHARGIWSSDEESDDIEVQPRVSQAAHLERVAEHIIDLVNEIEDRNPRLMRRMQETLAQIMDQYAVGGWSMARGERLSWRPTWNDDPIALFLENPNRCCHSNATDGSTFFAPFGSFNGDFTKGLRILGMDPLLNDGRLTGDRYNLTDWLIGQNAVQNQAMEYFFAAFMSHSRLPRGITAPKALSMILPFVRDPNFRLDIIRHYLVQVRDVREAAETTAILIHEYSYARTRLGHLLEADEDLWLGDRREATSYLFLKILNEGESFEVFNSLLRPGPNQIKPLRRVAVELAMDWKPSSAGSPCRSCENLWKSLNRHLSRTEMCLVPFLAKD